MGFKYQGEGTRARSLKVRMSKVKTGVQRASARALLMPLTKLIRYCEFSLITAEEHRPLHYSRVGKVISIKFSQW